MLEKTIAALKAVEAAIEEEYEGVKGWHASARGVLEDLGPSVSTVRTKLEKIDAPAEAPATEAPTEALTEAPAEEPPAEVPAEAPTEEVTASA